MDIDVSHFSVSLVVEGKGTVIRQCRPLKRKVWAKGDLLALMCHHDTWGHDDYIRKAIWSRRFQRTSEIPKSDVPTAHRALLPKCSHVKRIGVAETYLCPCGASDQTLDHVLQTCPLHEERCRKTWLNNTDLTTKLWETVEDLRRTAQVASLIDLKIWYTTCRTQKKKKNPHLADPSDITKTQLPKFTTRPKPLHSALTWWW